MDAGVDINGLTFSTFSGPGGARYNQTEGLYDHTIIVDVVRTTSKPNFFGRLFGVKSRNIVNVNIYENYRIPGRNAETGLPNAIGLTKRSNINYKNYSGGTGNGPFRLVTDKAPY